MDREAGPPPSREGLLTPTSSRALRQTVDGHSSTETRRRLHPRVRDGRKGGGYGSNALRGIAEPLTQELGLAKGARVRAGLRGMVFDRGPE